MDILVVDDNPLNANLARVILKRAGHAVRVADSAAAALLEVASARPDVVLTDINMPGTSGADLCRDLRGRHPTGTLRIVAYTALAMSEELRAIEQAGFDAVVVKPATRESLLAAVTGVAAAA